MDEGEKPNAITGQKWKSERDFFFLFYANRNLDEWPCSLRDELLLFICSELPTCLCSEGLMCVSKDVFMLINLCFWTVQRWRKRNKSKEFLVNTRRWSPYLIFFPFLFVWDLDFIGLWLTTICSCLVQTKSFLIGRKAVKDFVLDYEIILMVYLCKSWDMPFFLFGTKMC